MSAATGTAIGTAFTAGQFRAMASRQSATGAGLAQAIAPLPRDRVLTLRTLLRITDELRAHILGGRLAEAGAAQTRRDALLHLFFEQSVLPAERTAMIEACSAMLDMDEALLSCLEINRSRTAADLDALESRPSACEALPSRSNEP